MKDLREKLVPGTVLVLTCWLWIPALVVGMVARIVVEAVKLGWNIIKV